MTVHHERIRRSLVLRIDRPAKRNAIDRQTADALLAGFREFEKHAELRVLIVTGSTEAFCAGADLTAMNNDVDGEGGPLGFTRLSSAKPVLAAVEGWCVAGGLELAAYCDLRIAGAGSKFGCLERRWGVPLIDGGTQRLPRIVGLGRALDLILSGRVVDAHEAERIGLANRVVDEGDALAATIALADQLADFPQECLVADRLSVYEGLGAPLDRGLQIEAKRGHGVLAEARRGAQRFAGGAGRHGSGDD